MGKRSFADSATKYILEALIPYTDANLQLTFKPTLFFSHLEKVGRHKNQTYKNAFSTAKRKGLVSIGENRVPQLTAKGLSKIRPYRSRKLDKDSMLMIIFDIPEEKRYKRTQLRLLLRELSFKQAQKSVWITKLDHKEYLKKSVKDYSLDEYVQIYEVAKL